MSQLSIPTTTDFLGRSDSEPPIVVDLDQTLISTDLLVETFFVMLALVITNFGNINSA